MIKKQTNELFDCMYIDQANYQVDISHRMRDARTAEEDGWSKLCVSMGNSMSRLEVAYLRNCFQNEKLFDVFCFSFLLSQFTVNIVKK